MTITAREFDLLVNKLGLVTRDSRDLLAWFEHDGEVITWTKRSKQRSGDLPMQHSIHQQIKLTEDQLRRILACTVDRDGYVEILRGRGLL